nr:reverse transcriptase domain-containing protein [Tanacetum cinerariifolium]
MDSVKSPELAKRFSNKVPATVNEMMERLDDFVRSEEAYARTELSKGEVGETHRKCPFHSIEGTTGYPETSTRESHGGMSIEAVTEVEGTRTMRTEREMTGPIPPPRGEYNHRDTPVLTLEALTKRRKEILATETRLHLPAPRPMLNPLRSGNTDRGRGPHGREAPQPAKVINVISVNSMKDKKRNGREITEPWMNIPISFPAISSEDVKGNPNELGRVRGRNIKTIRKDRTGGRPGLKTLRAISATIHSMMKFPTPKGVATLL